MSRLQQYKFRLYIAGDAPNSLQAQANLLALCETNLPDRYEIEVVDVLKVPTLALKDNVLMTPTLLKLAPAPTRRIVGTLSQLQIVMETLGLQVSVK